MLVAPFKSDIAYVYHKSKDYKNYMVGRFIEFKNKINEIEKETFINERERKEKVSESLGISGKDMNKFIASGRDIISLLLKIITRMRID